MPTEQSETIVKQKLVILAVNDLESVEIYKLLLRSEVKIPVLAYNCAWGEKINYNKAEIQKLNISDNKITEILLVERKQKEDISVLKELYPDAEIKYLDHHSYSDEPEPEYKNKEDNKGKDILQKSALEQIIDHFPELKRHQDENVINKIVANDKDFIPGIAKILLDEERVFEQNENLLRKLWEVLDEELSFDLELGNFLANETLHKKLPKYEVEISDFIEEFGRINFDKTIEGIKSFRKRETLIQYAFKNVNETEIQPHLVKGEPFAVRVLADKNIYLDFMPLTEEVEAYVEQAETQRNMRHFSTNRVRDIGAPELTLIRYPSKYSFCIGDQLYYYEKKQKKRQFLTFCLSDFYEIDDERSQNISFGNNIYWRKKSLRNLCDQINQRVQGFYVNYRPYLGIMYDDTPMDHSHNPVYEDCHVGFIYSGQIASENKKMNLRKKADEICRTEKGMYSYGGKNYYGVQFHKKITTSDNIKLPLNNIIDHHLNQLLIDHRPLRAWRTSFFQPLSYRREEKRSDLKNIGNCFEAYEPEKQEKAFFLSYLRKLIVPKPVDQGTGFVDEKDNLGEAFIESYRYRPKADEPEFYACLEYPNAKNMIKLPITKIMVHFFYNETVIIEWQYEQTVRKWAGEASTLTSNAYWKRLLAGDYLYDEGGKDKMLSPAQVVDINEKLRFAYSTYITADVSPSFVLSLYRNKEIGQPLYYGQKVHIADNDMKHDGCDDFEGFFRALASQVLKPFGFYIAENKEDGRKADTITFLGDDRARLVSSMVLSGDKPDNIVTGNESWKILDPELDVLFSRFRVVDSYSRGYFSDQNFEKLDREGRFYDRYKNDGNLYGITDHSFVFMGYGDYALEHIHKKHMKTIYSRMFLVAQFYIAILHKFSKDVSENARKGIGFLELRKELNIFTNGFWFENISSQVQGKELFGMMRKNSSMNGDYELIHNEIERMDELEAANSSRMNERFERVIATMAIVGIGYTLLSLLNELWTYPVIKDSEIFRAWQNYHFSREVADIVYFVGLLGVFWIVCALFLYSSGFYEKLKQDYIEENGREPSWWKGVNYWLVSPVIWFFRKMLQPPIGWFLGKVRNYFTK